MRKHRNTSPTRAKRGEQATSPVPARSDIGENSASELIEARTRKKQDSKR